MIQFADKTSKRIVELLLEFEREIVAACRAAVSPRLYEMARELARRDGGELVDIIVIGWPKQSPIVFAGKGKSLTCMFTTPMYPAWVHYISDAQQAIDLVDNFPESARDDR